MSPPALSQTFKETRSIRIIPVSINKIQINLRNFDDVLGQIEGSVLTEMMGVQIKRCWSTNPIERTCTACDFKTFCISAAPGQYSPTVP